MPSHIHPEFLKEVYEKQQKYLAVNDKYRPNYYRRPLTGKFYSKYEEKTTGSYPDILEEIKFVKDGGPKEKLKWPETTNQWYGWYIDPLVELDRKDYRLYFPQKSSEFVKHQIKLTQGKIGGKHK